MGALAYKERGVSYPVSDEARERIDSTRVRDLAFYLRRTTTGLDSNDVNLLAEVLLQGLDEKVRIDREYVISSLQKRGRSRHKSEHLAEAFFQVKVAR